jgi:hypothetical protein
MKHPSAATRKPPPPGSILAGSRRLHEIRFVAGIAIAVGGAGVLLSDLIHLVPALG